METKPNSNESSLDQLADAYVSGALEPADAEQFEMRLLDDQAAREAVARAVEFLQVVHRAVELESESIAPATVGNPTRWSERVDWLATIGGACLLVCVIAFGLRTSDRPTDLTQGQGEPVPAVEDNELAVLWGEMLTAYPMNDETSEEGSVEELLSGLDEPELAIADSPDWMLAAVGELTARNDMDHEVDMENR